MPVVPKKKIKSPVRNNAPKSPLASQTCRNFKEVKGKNKLPTSGSEPVLNMRQWGSSKAITGANCYSFALDDRNYSPIKAVPGNKTHFPDLEKITCPILRKRLMADSPGKITPTKEKSRCGRGTYKIYMVADVNGRDFHFYRQVNDVKYWVRPGDTLRSIAKFFSISVDRIRACNPVIRNPLKIGSIIYLKGLNVFFQKRGFSTGALIKNANGKRIDDPSKSSGDFSKTETYGLNYKKNCGFFCVKVGTKSHN